MKANANDYSALDPVQDKALGAPLWLHDTQRWDLLISPPVNTVTIVIPTDEKLINPTLWGEEYIATQSWSMVDGVYWLSLHVQLQYVIAHTKAAFPLPLYSPFSLFARCCSNRTIAERVVGSFVRVTDIYSSHIEWVGSAILQQEKLYIYREKEGEREASVASNWFNSTAIASVSRVGDYGYNRSDKVTR